MTTKLPSVENDLFSCLLETSCVHKKLPRHHGSLSYLTKESIKGWQTKIRQCGPCLVSCHVTLVRRRLSHTVILLTVLDRNRSFCVLHRIQACDDETFLYRTLFMYYFYFDTYSFVQAFHFALYRRAYIYENYKKRTYICSLLLIILH